MQTPIAVSSFDGSQFAKTLAQLVIVGATGFVVIQGAGDAYQPAGTGDLDRAHA
jgi:hypothetical protein